MPLDFAVVFEATRVLPFVFGERFLVCREQCHHYVGQDFVFRDKGVDLVLVSVQYSNQHKERKEEKNACDTAALLVVERFVHSRCLLLHFGVYLMLGSL